MNRIQPYIIAEISGNHGNSWERCLKLLNACLVAGVSAIKTQHYRPESITIDSSRPEFVLPDTIWKDRTLYNIYSEGSMAFEWQKRIMDFCFDHALDFISTPFDNQCVDELLSIGCTNLKIASSDANDIAFISYAFEHATNAFVSLGMASEIEINRVVKAFGKSACSSLCLLQCTSAYPAPIEHANINRIHALKKLFSHEIGLSDHSLSEYLPLVALGAGATVFEKHVTLSRTDGALDSSFSLEPNELIHLVQTLNTYFPSLGEASFGPTPSESIAFKYRRSLYVVKHVKKGQTILQNDIKSIRPANGLSPHLLPFVVGSIALADLVPGTPLKLSDVELPT